MNWEDGVTDASILDRHLQSQSVALFQIQHLPTRTTYLHLDWNERNQVVPSTSLKTMPPTYKLWVVPTTKLIQPGELSGTKSWIKIQVNID